MYNPFTLEGKTILVTGASSGIGKDAAIRCSQMGANIIVTGRNEERLRETLEMLNNDGNHQIVVADLNNDEDIDVLCQTIEGSIDGIVFCAGVNDKFLLKAIKRENVDRMFNTNVFAPVLVTKELMKNKMINNASSIVFISSIASTYATITNTLYAASKGAINSIIRVWALELASKKIRVNGIQPGMVKTKMIDAYGLSEADMQSLEKSFPLGRLGETQDIVNAIIYFLSDASSWTTGTNLVVDGGMTLR